MLPLHPRLLKELHTVARLADRRNGIASIYLTQGKDYTVRLWTLQKQGYINIKVLIGILADVTVTDAGYVALGIAVLS